MIQKINDRLNEYLEFDNTLLYFDPMVRIFGGAIRDSIADQPINDIDILCGSKSQEMLEYLLTSKGYVRISKMASIDITYLYSNIHIISEPITYMKRNKVVQIIKPRIVDNFANKSNNSLDYYENFKALIQNVDLSCCGVSFGMDQDKKLSLFENYENAIIHSLNKTFVVNSYAKMYSENRCQHRVIKLQERGWKRIEEGIADNRDIKIDYILNNQITFQRTPEFIPIIRRDLPQKSIGKIRC